MAICDIAGEMEYIDHPLGTVQELEAVAQAVRDAGRRCVSQPCDVRKPEQVRSFVAQAMSEFGRIDIAIANAGVGSNGGFTEMSVGRWSATVDTNLSGAFYVCKYAATPMIAARSGRIIVTGSIASLGGLGRCAAYTASKHGIVGLVKGFALELAPHGVTINVVCPTAVDTPMNVQLEAGNETAVSWNADATRVIGSWNLFGDGMIDAREITEAMMWLASRDAHGVNGMALRVDGGCTCK